MSLRNGKKVNFLIQISDGKFGRKVIRNRIRISNSKIGKLVGTNPLGIRKTRQERKALAKKLKVPFEPRYNGKRFRIIQKLVQEENNKYPKLVKEYKELG